jgi:quercetin dioxygenase-like cupin family protein
MPVVDVFSFERKEREISAHESTGVHATRVAQFAGRTQATCLTVAAGGRIGTHPAEGAQVLLIVAGSGWVAGADQVRVPIRAGQAACWEPGEAHTTGSDTGLTAVALEGPAVRIFAAEGPPAG